MRIYKWIVIARSRISAVKAVTIPSGSTDFTHSSTGDEDAGLEKCNDKSNPLTEDGNVLRLKTFSWMQSGTHDSLPGGPDAGL